MNLINADHFVNGEELMKNINYLFSDEESIFVMKNGGLI